MDKGFSNALLEPAMQWLVDRWNTGLGGVLRLYRNDLEPTPSSTFADFVEANWPGYNPVLLLGQMTPPSMVADGDWESTTARFIFAPPATGLGNRIYGAYVTLNGVVEAWQRFTTPFDVIPGSPAIRFRLNPHGKSGSLFVVG